MAWGIQRRCLQCCGRAPAVLGVKSLLLQARGTSPTIANTDYVLRS